MEAEVIRDELGGVGGEPATPTEAPAQKEPEGRMGITTPSRRGSSSRFLTDVIVYMGLVARERVDDAIATSRSAGTTPERVLVEAGPSAMTASRARWQSATASTTSTSGSSRWTWGRPTS